jgi:hypothetical protein
MNGRDHLGDMGIDNNRILKSILKKQCMKICTG